MDVDGVLTNGKLYYLNENYVGRAFDSKDGMAIRLLQENNIKIVWISGGQSSSISERAEDLDVEMYYTMIKDKKSLLEKIQIEHKISIEETIFLGDDINDLPTKPLCKLFLCPRDASNTVKLNSDWIGQNSGGSGFVREVVDYIMEILSIKKDQGWNTLN